MKALKVILGIILVLVIILVIAYAFFGGFKKVECSVVQTGGEVFVYEELKGDYSQSALVMDKIYYDLLDNYKLETFKGCGMYYNNPQTTDVADLRSDVGCLLEAKDSNKVTMLEAKYNIKTLAQGDYIVAQFPFKGKMSVFLGIMKVYPAINTFVKENGYSEQGPITEIYDMPNKRIVYRKEIVKE
ncbi:MAG: GyrI-like domain-containing protein [Bacteroidales bacterium]|jgi:hypothetical protein|nr:GyrI-like domain-containing protein [Bacteroidales bacterium]MDD2688247.1 GyrI-like domain-containing protein [Bacteroidales bacterium]MDD3330963.1 GyrI-like domain-containing protein [Bacteroidales bacterium]MDD3691828.1 GyrI-like domain-containing protein [Bacteroidales bacterium]MDD4045143.1 GyrI-like domain-containing protein [Bacteroidales bacterium]